MAVLEEAVPPELGGSMDGSGADNSDAGYVINFGEFPPLRENGVSSWYVRLQNTLMVWSEISAAQSVAHQEYAHEFLVVLPDVGATLVAGGKTVAAPARSVCIFPAGPASIAPQGPGRVICFFSPVPEALASKAINHADYAGLRAPVKPIDAPFVRIGAPDIRVYEIGPPQPKRRGRPPSFQTSTMNVMWIEQQGPHDRGKLAPHFHDDFEEGALVVAGDYVQHLRTPWNADARLWREDQHRPCGPRTLAIVPPQVIHTTQAQGAGLHIMLNIFAPARADHIQSGLVLTAGEYRAAPPMGPS
jgi:hypothetical protein